MIRQARKTIIPLVLFAAAVFFMLGPPLAEAVEKFPRPIGAVNDFASLISPQYRQEMTALAQEVLEKTGTSVVVVTLPTVGDNEPTDYANRLYRAWGIGKKGEDKGVLIFLALKERRIRIETGYGVEGILPDGLVGEILDRDVTPSLRKGDYGRGLLNAMVSVSRVIAQDAKVSLSGRPRVSGDAASRKKRSVSRTSNAMSLLVLVVIAVLLLGTKRGRDILPLILFLLLSGSGRGGGGGFGGFGGGGFGGFGGGSSGGGGAGRSF